MGSDNQVFIPTKNFVGQPFEGNIVSFALWFNFCDTFFQVINHLNFFSTIAKFQRFFSRFNFLFREVIFINY